MNLVSHMAPCSGGRTLYLILQNGGGLPIHIKYLILLFITDFEKISNA